MFRKVLSAVSVVASIISKPVAILGDKMDDTLTQQAVKSIAGKAAFLAAAWLAQHGMIDGSGVEAVAGAIAALAVTLVRAQKPAKA